MTLSVCSDLLPVVTQLKADFSIQIFNTLNGGSVKNYIKRTGEDMVFSELTFGLSKAISTYTGGEASDDVLLACAELIISTFAFLSKGEIKEAFNLYAANKLQNAEGKPVDDLMATYGKNFGVVHLGKLLQAYTEHRKVEVKRLSELISKAETEAARQRRIDASSKFDYDKMYCDEVQDIIVNGTSRMILARHYEALERKGLVNIPKEKKVELYDAAKRQILAGLNGDAFTNIIRRKEIEAEAAAVKSGDKEAEVKVLAKCLAVEFYIKCEREKLK